MFFFSAQRQIGCAMQCNAMQCNNTRYVFNQHWNDLVLVCNAMQEGHGLYVILQCTTLDRQCNAMQCKVMQSNANQCKSMQCNTMQCNNTRYVFNEHGNDLVLVCNAMQEVHNLYAILQCTTLDRLCNAMQQHICYLFNEHGNELVSGVQCNARSA